MKVSELVDRFDDADPTLWDYDGSGAGVRAGRLELPLSPGAGLSSVGVYELAGSRLLVELAEVPTGAGNFVSVGLTNPTAGGFAFRITAGRIVAERRIGQTFTEAWSAAYEHIAHRWVAIRHDPVSAAVVFETSHDGLDWTARGALAPNMGLADLTVFASAGVQEGAPASSSVALVDNLNAPPPGEGDDPRTTIITDGNAPNLAIDVQPEGAPLGTFLLDVSELDGADRLAWGDNPAGWVNIVCDVTGVRIARGATNLLGPLTRTEAGSCAVELIDIERRFDPTMNADAIRPGVPMRVRAWGDAAPSLELVEQRRNRAPNPRTVGSTALFAGTNTTASLVGGKLRATLQTLATAGPGAGYMQAVREAAMNYPNGRFAAVAGQRVAARVEVTNPNAAARTVRLSIDRYTWAGDLASGSFSSSGTASAAWVTIPAGQTTTLELVSTIPAGTTTHVLPTVAFAGATSSTAPTGSEVFDLTRWALFVGADAPAAVPVPYFDATAPAVGSGEGALSYAWAGLANASDSIEYLAELVFAPWSVVLFTGKINGDGISVVYRKDDAPAVTLNAVDLIGTLARWRARGNDPEVGAGDTLLERVERVLAEVGIDDAIALSPDPTYSATLNATPLSNAWASIDAAAEAELGRVWVDADNRLAVRARGAELSGPVRGTLSDWHGEVIDDLGVHCCYADPLVRYSPGQLVNRSVAARRGGGITVQLDDEPSQARFDVAADEHTSLELERDDQLEAWAGALIAGQTVPRVRVDELAPMPRTAPEAWQAVVATDIGDRWNFRLHPPVGATVAQTLGVLGVVHDITPDEWSIAWTTAKAPSVNGENPSGWFVLDLSELDGGDLLAPFAPA